MAGKCSVSLLVALYTLHKLRVLQMLDGRVQMLPNILHPAECSPRPRCKRVLHQSYLRLPLPVLLLFPSHRRGHVVTTQHTAPGCISNDPECFDEHVAGVCTCACASAATARFHKRLGPVPKCWRSRFRHH